MCHGASVPNPIKKFFVEEDIPEWNLEQGVLESDLAQIGVLGVKNKQDKH